MTALADRAVDWLTQSHVRAVALLSLLALLCFLPGLASIPPIDRDEALFVQSTRQMLETGNYVDIRFQDVPRYKKPIGIYWLQAAAVKLSGSGADAPIALYRLASVAGALAGVLLTYWAGVPLFGRRAALAAAALMAVSVVLVSEAHLAKTDAVLLATVVLAQGALARIYLWRGSGKPPFAVALLFWVGIGIGVLVKGPVVLLVAGLTIVTLVAIDRRAGWLLGLRPVAGVLVAAAIVLPWLIAILSISGNAFLGQSVGNDFLGKLASGQQGHSAPPGTHLALLFAMFAPGAALIPAAAGWVWRQRGTPSVRFCLAWLVPSFLAFEAVATKLPHYTLPTYPAIALLIGGALAAGNLAIDRAIGRLPALAALGGVVAWAAAALVVMDQYGGGVTVPAVAGAVFVAVLAAIAVTPVLRGQATTSIAVLILAAASLYGLAFGIILPAASRVLLTPRLVAAIGADASCPRSTVFSAGYAEPSLVFAAGTDTSFGDGGQAADFLKAGACRVAVVTAANSDAFVAEAANVGLAVAKRASVQGLNLGRFGIVSADVYRAATLTP